MELKNTFDLLAVKHAIENGITYLLSQATDGRWRGFPTLAGKSDIWVTGFIVAHINKLCEGENIITGAQDFLKKSRQPTNGWSYSTIVPSDSDSTAWCLMALKSSTILTNLELNKATSFLWSHFINNGVSTYSINSGIREFISAPNNDAIQGWTSVHPDVSIAAVLSDIKNKNVPKILTWLINLQKEEGFIDSYWWRSSYYTTTLLLRALSMRHESLPNEHAKKIIQNLAKKQLPDGGFGIDKSTISDPFTTALALESLVYISYIENVSEKHFCVKSLLHSQNKDGSWNGDFILRIPAPHILNPDDVVSWNYENGGGNSFVKDQDGLFATAMACYALNCFKQSELNKINNISSKTYNS